MNIPWESPFWNGKISVAFSYPSDGWVLMAIMTTVFNQHIVIHCSDVFSPFEDMLAWLNDIAENKLPAEFTIDEEGITKTLIVKNYKLNSEEIEFFIEGDYWQPKENCYKNENFLRCRANRLQLVEEFAKRLKAWLMNDYDMFGFGYSSEEDYQDGYGFDLRNLNIQKLINKLFDLGGKPP